MHRRLSFFISILVLSVALTQVSLAKAPGFSAKAIGSTAQMPVYFTKNMGQWPDSILFRCSGGGTTMWFTRNGIWYQFTKRISKPTRSQSTLAAGIVPDRLALPDKFLHDRDSTETTLVKAEYAGASPTAVVKGFEEEAYKCNYFIGNDRAKWHTGVPNYSAVTMKGIYPGVDATFRGKNGRLEYELIGASASAAQVNVKYHGARAVSLQPDGSTTVTTNFGEQKFLGILPESESAPVARTVTVNPANPESVALAYSTYLGGGSYDCGYGIAVDDSGNAYVTGWTASANFPTQNPYQTSPRSTDVFVTKFSASGDSLIYSTYLGGSDQDLSYGIAVDSSGHAYVTGATHSTDFPTQNPFQTYKDYPAVFVTKLSATGDSLTYSTYLGGGGWDCGCGIAVDRNGNAYVTGQAGPGFPTQNPFQTYQGPNDCDAFVTKLSATGNSLIYSTYLGGSSGDAGYGIAVDDSGNAYVTGSTISTNFPTQNAYQGTYQGGDGDVFVSKLSSTGNSLIYSTYLGGSDYDEPGGIAVDDSGNAYVTGWTGSTNFPTHNPLQVFQGPSGSCDAFVTKLSPGGYSLVYSTYLGGVGTDYANGIAVDADGNACVTGWTTSVDFPTLNAYDNSNHGGYRCAFVTKLAPSGNAFVYSTYLGGSSYDQAYGIALDADGNAYVTGGTYSTDFPTLNAYQNTQGGYWDAFVTKLAMAHDVRTLYILAPKDSVALSSTVTPQAVVKNVGTNAETFPVIFQIASFYFDTAIVNSLAPGDTQLVSFRSWIATPAGTYSPLCYTNLMGDEYRSDDSARGYVIVRQVGPVPVITLVKPNSYGNDGTLTLRLNGHEFRNGTTVTLTGPGGASLVADTLSAVVHDSTTMQAEFDVTGIPVGNWDITVASGDGQHSTFYGGLTILPASAALEIDILGPQNIRLGRSELFLVTYSNGGNTDISNRAIWLQLPSNVVVDSVDLPTLEGGPRHISADSPLFIYLPTVTPGASGKVHVFLRSLSVRDSVLTLSPVVVPALDGSAGGGMRNWLDGTRVQGFLTYSPREGYPPVGSIVIRKSNSTDFPSGHVGIYVGPNGTIIELIPTNNNWFQPVTIRETNLANWTAALDGEYVGAIRPTFWPDGIGQRIVGEAERQLAAGSSTWFCAPPAGNSTDCVQFVWEVYRAVGLDLPWKSWVSPAAIYESAFPELWPDNGPGYILAPSFWLEGGFVTKIATSLTKSISVVYSRDPNLKVASEGFGLMLHFVQPNQELSYMIFFQNDSLATAKAESIIVTDTLDSDLDWSTLAFGEVSPGSGPDSIRPNYLPTESFNSATGVITWNLANIDLPPDVAPYWGEGWMSYSVKPKGGLPTGTKIKNIAAIKFDQNQWILAPMNGVPVFNTIDAGAPTSSVQSLPDSSPPQFTVHWSGVDDSAGSGIAAYSIYFSTDSVHYSPWILDTTVTSALFTGSVGQKLFFYSIARDSVGNVEAAPAVPDAKTRISTCCVGHTGNVNMSGIVDLADLTALVSFLTGGGYVLPCPAAANVNGTGTIDLGDLSALVSYLTGGGFVLPNCPVTMPTKSTPVQAKPKINATRAKDRIKSAANAGK